MNCLAVSLLVRCRPASLFGDIFTAFFFFSSRSMDFFWATQASLRARRSTSENRNTRLIAVGHWHASLSVAAADHRRPRSAFHASLTESRHPRDLQPVTVDLSRRHARARPSPTGSFTCPRILSALLKNHRNNTFPSAWRIFFSF